MKRKFSLNLAPVKVPLRSEAHAKQTPEPASSSHTPSHRRHASKDSWSAPASPYINRRPLDATTERELRAACRLILQNFKPSDADFADADPKLDFSGPHKRREQRAEASLPSHIANEVRAHRPTGAPSHLRSAHDARHHAPSGDIAAKAYPDLPMLANTGRRREGQAADNEIERGRAVKSPTHDAARPAAAVRADADSDDAKSLATPLTASTDARVNSGSTAPTSVASNRASRQYDTAAATADAQATEWMRQELKKRRQKEASNFHSEQSQSALRPPSRAGSIRAGIKDYIFPGSKNLTRSQSRDSVRTANSQSTDHHIKRSGSVTGWRSWGLHRMGSSRSSSRPGTSSGRVERSEHDKKADLDLNRKLPPLPSLDTWKDFEVKDKERRKSQNQGSHIADVMRTQDQQQQEYAAAVRRHHRRSGSDTMVLRYAKSNAHAQSSSSRVRSPVQPNFSYKPAEASFDTTMDFDQMMTAMSSSRNLDDHLKLHDPNSHTHGHVPQRSTSSASRSPSTNLGSSSRLHAPNFSRKISAEVPRPSQSHVGGQDAVYVRAMQISAPAIEGVGRGQEQHKSTLKKVFRGWMSNKKDKKEDWMGTFEKKGVRSGIMTQDEAAYPPIVRY